MITEKKLKEELKKLKEEINKEYPKEIECETYAVKTLYKDEFTSEKELNKEKENLKKRGFILHKTEINKSTLALYWWNTKEIWIKKISERTIY